MKLYGFFKKNHFIAFLLGSFGFLTTSYALEDFVYSEESPVMSQAIEGTLQVLNNKKEAEVPIQDFESIDKLMQMNEGQNNSPKNCSNKSKAGKLPKKINLCSIKNDQKKLNQCSIKGVYKAKVSQKFKECIDGIYKYQSQKNPQMAFTSYENLLKGVYYFPFVKELSQYHLNGDDLIAMKAYSMEYYTWINLALWQNQDTEKYQCFIDQLNETLKKLPDYKGPVIRGLKIPSEKMADYKVGATIPFLGFTSTTEGSEISEIFEQQPHYMKIISKHGKNISSFTKSGETENEVLFPSNTNFILCSRRTDSVGMDKKLILEMVEKENGAGLADKGENCSP